MRHLLLVVAAALAIANLAGAQSVPPTPLTRADLHAVVGWENLAIRNRPTPTRGGEWVNSIFWGGAGAGWYWTDHLKTQVDFGAGTEADQYRYTTIVVEGQPANAFSQLALRRRSLALAQQYQFFRNRWFHPYVGGGASVAWTTTTERFEPISVYDATTRTSRLVAPGQTLGPIRTRTVTPFGTLGFKAYMARRVFFTSDMRVMVDNGVDEVLFRLGFGVDF